MPGLDHHTVGFAQALAAVFFTAHMYIFAKLRGHQVAAKPSKTKKKRR